MTNYNKLVSFAMAAVIHGNFTCLCWGEAEMEREENKIKRLENEVSERNNKIESINEINKKLTKGHIIGVDDNCDEDIKGKINDISKNVTEAIDEMKLEESKVEEIKASVLSLYAICFEKDNIDKYSKPIKTLAEFIFKSIRTALGKQIPSRFFNEKYLGKFTFTDDSTLNYNIHFILSEIEILDQVIRHYNRKKKKTINDLFKKITFKGHIDSKVNKVIDGKFDVKDSYDVVKSDIDSITVGLKSIILSYIVDYVKYFEKILSFTFNTKKKSQAITITTTSLIEDTEASKCHEVLGDSKTYSSLCSLSLKDLTNLFFIVERTKFVQNPVSMENIFKDSNNDGNFKIINKTGAMGLCDLVIYVDKQISDTDIANSKFYKDILFAPIRKAAFFEKYKDIKTKKNNNVEEDPFNTNKDHAITSSSNTFISQIDW